MSTWQIFTDAGNTFRWEVSDHQLRGDMDAKPNDSPIQGPNHLPSMSDLLLQGQERSKLTEPGGGGIGECLPIFRTGLGKAFGMNQSCLSKALSILGDEDSELDTGQLGGGDNGCALSKSTMQTGSGKMINTPNSMFQTGSGKAVNITSVGLIKAKTLLGLGEYNDEDTRTELNASINRRSASHVEVMEGLTVTGFKNAAPALLTPLKFKLSSGGSESMEATADFVHSAPKTSPIRFHTAGGRSVSVSSDALQRARSLLGDPDLGNFLNEGDECDPVFSYSDNSNSMNRENDPSSSVALQRTINRKHTSGNFTSPVRVTSSGSHFPVMSRNVTTGSNLIKRFDEVAHVSTRWLHDSVPSLEEPISNRNCVVGVLSGISSANGTDSNNYQPRKSSCGPLVDVSNSIDNVNHTPINCERRRLGRISSASPFKRPRSSKFRAPLNTNILLVPKGLSTLPSEESPCKRRVSSRYPPLAPRKYIREYFGVPSLHQIMCEYLPEWIKRMNPQGAEKHMFPDESGLDCIGAEALRGMLVQSGASALFASEEWVANHFKWIVWKSACYERCYPDKYSGKFLTVLNVLEELKYRYEREVNYGERSAIKKVLEGDAPPSSVMALCISTIHTVCDLKTGSPSNLLDGAENNKAVKIELTDGWYSVNAILDEPLSRKVAARKLFVGQKLRIWGAGLCGWVGPISPLKAAGTVSLVLHLNGTYRAHWADRLGFCKNGAVPLAFRCIKRNGGLVPRTLVGVTRIYPVMYRERLNDGRFAVWSERVEAKMMQLYNQRRSNVAEGIVSEFQRGLKDIHSNNDPDSEEGAKILKMLETAAEPEVLMAEMSSDQLTSFVAYQAKIEAMRQSDMQRAIEKGLEDAGLAEREVTPFMRVRVVGLTCKSSDRNDCPGEGIITIWSPTEKQDELLMLPQQSELVEGQAYAIAGLVPMNNNLDMLHLRARGSTAKWLPLSSSEMQHFMPFFNPRKSVSIASLSEVPLSSEFDIAAFVVYVGAVYTAANKKMQWVFVADGSVSELSSEELSDGLLAISFCLPHFDHDLCIPINYNLKGSTVGFCNLIKRERDLMNCLWVAEATENSTYFLSYDHVRCSHLKDAAASAQNWAKISTLMIEKLRGKVISVVGNGKH